MIDWHELFSILKDFIPVLAVVAVISAGFWLAYYLSFHSLWNRIDRTIYLRLGASESV